MATKKSTGATTKPATGKTTKKSVRPKKKTTAAKTVRAKKPATAKKVTTAKPKTATAIKVVSSEERAHLIEVAAYLRSETRGFVQGGAVEDWLLAEQEVDLQLRHP